MRKSKKFILIAVVVAIALAGSLTGVALAQDDNTSTTGQSKTLLGRVATILGIDQQKVEDAFTQAQKEMRDERLDSYLNSLVEDGKITQEQADQYKSWWQSRPDISITGLSEPGFGHLGRGMMGDKECLPNIVPDVSSSTDTN